MDTTHLHAHAHAHTCTVTATASRNKIIHTLSQRTPLAARGHWPARTTAVDKDVMLTQAQIQQPRRQSTPLLVLRALRALQAATRRLAAARRRVEPWEPPLRRRAPSARAPSGMRGARTACRTRDGSTRTASRHGGCARVPADLNWTPPTDAHTPDTHVQCYSNMNDATVVWSGPNCCHRKTAEPSGDVANTATTQETPACAPKKHPHTQPHL